MTDPWLIPAAALTLGAVVGAATLQWQARRPRTPVASVRSRILRLEHETGIVTRHDDIEGCVLCLQKRSFVALRFEHWYVPPGVRRGQERSNLDGDAGLGVGDRESDISDPPWDAGV